MSLHTIKNHAKRIFQPLQFAFMDGFHANSGKSMYSNHLPITFAKRIAHPFQPLTKIKDPTDLNTVSQNLHAEYNHQHDPKALVNALYLSNLAKFVGYTSLACRGTFKNNGRQKKHLHPDLRAAMNRMALYFPENLKVHLSLEAAETLAKLENNLGKEKDVELSDEKIIQLLSEIKHKIIDQGLVPKNKYEANQKANEYYLKYVSVYKKNKPDIEKDWLDAGRWSYMPRLFGLSPSHFAMNALNIAFIVTKNTACAIAGLSIASVARIAADGIMGILRKNMKVINECCAFIKYTGKLENDYDAKKAYEALLALPKGAIPSLKLVQNVRAVRLREKIELTGSAHQIRNNSISAIFQISTMIASDICTLSGVGMPVKLALGGVSCLISLFTHGFNFYQAANDLIAKYNYTITATLQMAEYRNEDKDFFTATKENVRNLSLLRQDMDDNKKLSKDAVEKSLNKIVDTSNIKKSWKEVDTYKIENSQEYLNIQFSNKSYEFFSLKNKQMSLTKRNKKPIASIDEKIKKLATELDEIKTDIGIISTVKKHAQSPESIEQHLRKMSSKESKNVLNALISNRENYKLNCKLKSLTIGERFRYISSYLGPSLLTATFLSPLLMITSGLLPNSIKIPMVGKFSYILASSLQFFATSANSGYRDEFKKHLSASIKQGNKKKIAKKIGKSSKISSMDLSPSSSSNLSQSPSTPLNVDFTKTIAVTPIKSFTQLMDNTPENECLIDGFIAQSTVAFLDEKGNALKIPLDKSLHNNKLTSVKKEKSKMFFNCTSIQMPYYHIQLAKMIEKKLH